MISSPFLKSVIERLAAFHDQETVCLLKFFKFGVNYNDSNNT